MNKPIDLDHELVEQHNLRITDDLYALRDAMEDVYRRDLADTAGKAAAYIAHLRGKLDGPAPKPSFTGIERWAKGASVTLEVPCDDEGKMLNGEIVTVHDLLYWMAKNAPCEAHREFMAAMDGVTFGRTSDGFDRHSINEVGLYSVTHRPTGTELFRVWVVPADKPANTVIAPIGIDGLICGDWLAEQVERRMEALRDESIDARQRLDRAADALKDFANRIGQATC